MARTGTRRWVGAVLALAIVTGIASTVVLPLRPAAAGTIAGAKAQAAAIEARIQATNQQLSTLSDQYTAAEGRLAQLNGQIAGSQAQLAKDQAQVDNDMAQLRTQAINSYMNEGTSNQLSQLFSSNSSTAGIRSEYSSIAAGNVTITVDNLHTAQSQLQTAQSHLKQQETQALATKASVSAAENQSNALVAREQSQLNGVNATIQQLVNQQIQQAQAAAAAAVQRAFNAKLAAAQAAQAASQAAASRAAAAAAAAQRTVVNSGAGGATTLYNGGSGSYSPPSYSALPPLAGGAAGAVQAAEREIGVPYVWGGATPSGFDCSGLVMWAWAQVGVSLPHYSGSQYNATTHIPLADIQPGDILFYGPGGTQHEAMYIGNGQMIEAPHTGATVWITGVRTGAGFVGVGRVQ